MAKEYRYPLTRLCIRTGALTLPARLITLFPDEGTVLLRDNEHEVEVLASVPEARVVTGLAEYFSDLEVEVNDNLYLTPQTDGSFTMRLVKRPRRERIHVEVEPDDIPEVVAVTSEPPAAPEPKLAPEPEHPAVPAETAPPAWQRGPASPQVSTPAWGLFTEVDEPEETPDPEPEFTERAFETPMFSETTASRQASEQASEPVREPQHTFDEVAHTVPLADLQDRLTAELAPFGFTTEIVADDLVAAYAQLGSKSYSVLFRILPAKERLDWGVLLTLRRGGTYDYVAIIGEHHDLIGVSNPAAVARTTLVSWDALARANQLRRGVPITALDFEPYLKEIGLFEEGLAHFEDEVASKLAARGNLSELLTTLAPRHAPSVLSVTELDAALGDLAGGELEQLITLLTGAPFHLFERLSDREVLLTRRVSEMLDAVGLYTESLAAQLEVE